VRWRMAAVVVAAGGVTTLLAVLVLNTMSDGWFLFYLAGLPSDYGLWAEGKLRFWTRDLIPTMPIALLAAAAYMCTPKAPGRSFYFSMAAGLIAAAWLSRVKVGGFSNVLIPAHAILALLTGLSLSTWSSRLRERLPPRLLPRTWLYAVAIGQFLMLAYNPMDHLPRASSRAAGDALVQIIRDTNGPVWVPYHAYLAELGGKPGHAHWMAVSEILSHGTPKIREDLSVELRAAISERRYRMIVMSSYPFADFPPIEDSYELKQDLFGADKKVFLPLTGARRRPEKIYLPK
jgi:hypothetical protein